MNSRLGKFIDEYENIHYLRDLIGTGGQGSVFRTDDPDIAIKLILDQFGNPITDEKLVKWYSNLFKTVRLMPLPEDSKVAVPLAVLQYRAGYVMQLLNDMVPIKNLISNSKFIENTSSDTLPDWLPSIPENEAKKIVYYCKSGGLRRRLLALYKCASILVRIHGNGMVYGDVSPNNIFISKLIDDQSVWLIDSDNIRFETSKGGNRIYTPKFGAPELVQGKGLGTPASDCYAFAVVAFYTLSMIHPFFGKKLDGTEEIDWADAEKETENVEEMAYNGNLPWVDDRNDDSNSSSQGLPRQLVTTSRLADLFEYTFGPGRNSPNLRPATYHWPEALAQAADKTVICPNCEMSYFYYNHESTDKISCPYCKSHPPQVLILSSYRWTGVAPCLANPCWQFIREFTHESRLAIPKRVFADFRIEDSDNPELEVESMDRGIQIRKSDLGNIVFSIASHNRRHSDFHKLRSIIEINRDEADVQFWIYANTSEPRLVSCSICGGKK